VWHFAVNNMDKAFRLMLKWTGSTYKGIVPVYQFGVVQLYTKFCKTTSNEPLR